MGMTAERQKIRAAEWLYRWNLSSSIIGIVFTILTFMGVFTIVLGPIFTEKFGFTYLQTALLLFLFVLGVIIGFGVYLDKVIHFWSAQATVARMRNLAQRHVVRAMDHGVSGLLFHTLRVVAHLLSRFGAQSSRRLVRQEQTRIVCQGHCDRDPLLFATAQLIRSMDGPLRHPAELKQFLRTLGPGRRPLPRQAHRQLDVLLGGQRGDEVEELEDETDLLQAIPNELGIAKVDQVRSVHLDSPRGWPVDSAEQVQEGRLSTAGRTPHRDELAVRDRHVEPPKGDDLGLSRAIHLDDILRCHVRHP